MSAFAARFFILAGFLRIFDNTCPGINIVTVLLKGSLPQPPQLTAYIRIFHTQRAVLIPREGGSARTAAGFELRHIRTAGRIVDLLIFPGDNSVLHEHLPAAGARTVYSVCGTDDFIVRPALAVHIFPISIFLFKNGPFPGIALDRFKKVKAEFLLHRLRTLLCE
ncbi:hypothetical protein D3C75_323380 [compost metagenome]